MNWSCPYCVWLVGREIELEVKWHCQGQAKTEWLSSPLIHGQLSDLSIRLEGSTSRVVFWVPWTHSIWKLWKAGPPLSHLLPFAVQGTIIVQESVSGCKCIPSSPISKDTHQVFFCTSGQRIMSAGWAVKPPADWASYNLWLISADNNFL